MTHTSTSHVNIYHILSQEMVAAAKLAARKEKEAKRRETIAHKLKLKKDDDEEVEAKCLHEEEEVRTVFLSHLSCSSSIHIMCSHLILIYTCINCTHRRKDKKMSWQLLLQIKHTAEKREKANAAKKARKEKAKAEAEQRKKDEEVSVL